MSAPPEGTLRAAQSSSCAILSKTNWPTNGSRWKGRTVQVLEEVERRIGAGIHDEFGVAHGGDEQYDGHEAHLSYQRLIKTMNVLYIRISSIWNVGHAESNAVAHQQIAGDRETNKPRRE